MKNLRYDDEQTGSDDESEETIALLVLERGAEWPSWGTGIRMRAANSAVEVQLDSETTADFEKRVFARLAHIARKQMRLVAAGYACALIPSSSDESSQALQRESRKEICTSVLNHLAKERGAELILAGGSWEITGEEGRQRSQLIELWGELSIQVPGRLMSVRFEEPPSESGVFRAAQKLEPLPPASGDFQERGVTKASLRDPDEKQSSDSGIS